MLTGTTKLESFVKNWIEYVCTAQGREGWSKKNVHRAVISPLVNWSASYATRR